MNKNVFITLLVPLFLFSCKTEEEKLLERVSECWEIQNILDKELKEFTNQYGMIEPETRFALYQDFENKLSDFPIKVIVEFKKERFSRDSVNDIKAFANYNEYLNKEAEAEKKRLDKVSFEVSFGGNDYRVNRKEWNDFKAKGKEFDIEASKSMRSAMGASKAHGLSNSLYRTFSKGIAREGLTMEAVRGIQVYDIMSSGDVKFH